MKKLILMSAMLVGMFSIQAHADIVKKTSPYHIINNIGNIGIEHTRDPDDKTDLANRYHNNAVTPWVTDDVANAWRDGWTGYGVNVGIIDNFNAGEPHGNEVLGVAVGSKGVPGIAPSANVKSYNFKDYSYLQYTLDPNLQVINNSYARFLYDGPNTPDGAHALNLNPTSNRTWIKEATGYVRHTETPTDVLNVWAAGNSHQECAIAARCTLQGIIATGDVNVTEIAGAYPDGYPRQIAVVNYTRDPSNKAIIVGAVDSNNKRTFYSNAAGVLKEDFIVAEDKIAALNKYGQPGMGTSFAAPRVTGAAALIIQKFRTNASNTKSILLETADGLGSCSGVSKRISCADDIYGHGKLNIAAAMSPYGIIR